MSVFGFIENFFFVSLALVFILVLFLVYHFKSRITVAEKKSESMYGLLTAVVKEIKLLRGMFGLGSTENAPLTPKQESINMEVKSKTEPEVNVPISASSSGNNTFESFVKMDAPSKEVITFEIIEAENRIVVSDMDDSDSDDESAESITPQSEEDNDSDSDSDSVSIESVHFIKTISSHREEVVDVCLENIIDELLLNQLEEEPVVNAEELVVNADEPVVNADEPVVNADEPVVNANEPVVNANEPVVNAKELVVSAEELVVNAEELVVNAEELDISAFENEQNGLNQSISEMESIASEPIAENESTDVNRLETEPVDANVNKNKPTIEQLRKMNINQLKTIASQQGIAEDISKMKKPELISLIQQK